MMVVGGEGGLQDAGGRVRVNSLQAQGWARESGGGGGRFGGLWQMRCRYYQCCSRCLQQREGLKAQAAQRARTSKLRHSNPGHHRHYSLIDRRRPWSAESAAAGACARNAGGRARRGTSSTASSTRLPPAHRRRPPLAHLPTCTSLPRQHQIAAHFGRARGRPHS